MVGGDALDGEVVVVMVVLLLLGKRSMPVMLTGTEMVLDESVDEEA